MTWTHTVTGGPWPARIDRRCRIVPAPAMAPDGRPARYPWSQLLDGQVVIFVEDDPLRWGVDWTCVVLRDEITALES